MKIPLHSLTKAAVAASLAFNDLYEDMELQIARNTNVWGGFVYGAAVLIDHLAFPLHLIQNAPTRVREISFMIANHVVWKLEGEPGERPDGLGLFQSGSVVTLPDNTVMMIRIANNLMTSAVYGDGRHSLHTITQTMMILEQSSFRLEIPRGYTAPAQFEMGLGMAMGCIAPIPIAIGGTGDFRDHGREAIEKMIQRVQERTR